MKFPREFPRSIGAANFIMMLVYSLISGELRSASLHLLRVRSVGALGVVDSSFFFDDLCFAPLVAVF